MHEDFDKRKKLECHRRRHLYRLTQPELSLLFASSGALCCHMLWLYLIQKWHPSIVLPWWRCRCPFVAVPYLQVYSLLLLRAGCQVHLSQLVGTLHVTRVS